MAQDHRDVWSRREFLGGMAMTGAAAMLGWRPELAMAVNEPPPETTTLRLRVWRPACWAPFHVAEPLLREEGFTDIQYVMAPGPKTVPLWRDGAIDLSPTFSALDMYQIEKHQHPITFLAGLHVGCFALIGSERVKSMNDLKGKTVWTGSVENNGPQIFFKSIVSYIGLDPDKDVNYAWVKKDEALRMFTEGKIDLFLAFPPGPQELMDKGVGRLLLDTNVDKPWSQYFCCMITGHNDFVKKNPIATKRALRAILKANDIVASDPDLALRVLMEKKIWTKAETKYILQAIKEIPYSLWREYNPEETIRFYALRLREVGLIKTQPEEFIRKHTDWSHLASMKQELGLKW
jgi:NitT/TauT family transport system substrate-binding protein